MERGKGTEVEHIWGWMDDKTRDLIKLLFAERLSQFNSELDKTAAERNDTEYGQFQGWKEKMTAKCPELDADIEAFMEWAMFCGAEETQDAYVFGMMDGIRLMKVIDWVLGG